MHEIVVVVQAWLEDCLQVHVLDAEVLGNSDCACIHEGHETAEHIHRIEVRDRLSPGLPRSAMPHVRQLLRRVGLLKPRLLHDYHTICGGPGPTNYPAEVVSEILQHRCRIRDARTELRGSCPHGPCLSVPRTEIRAHRHGTEPSVSEPPEQLDESQLPRPPAERALRVTVKDLAHQGRGRFVASRSAALEPLEDVVSPNHDDDGIEAAILRQHFLENEIEMSRRDPRVTDVSDVYPGGSEHRQALRCLEQALEGSGPALGLVRRKSFDWTPARREDSVQAVPGTGDIVPTLAIRVNLEPDQGFQLRQRFPVQVATEPQTGRPHPIGHAAQPPAGAELCPDPHERQPDRDSKSPRQEAHARFHARRRPSCARRSRYGSFRYTKNTDVTPKSSTMATPAPARPARLRTSRPSLNQSNKAKTGKAPRAARGMTYRA